MRKSVFLICLLLFFLHACAKTETPSFTDSSLYLFGDSLSDVGNANISSAGLVPDKNYYDGRFSNGEIYPDFLAKAFSTPMKPSQSYGSNYAFALMRSLEIKAQIFNFQENVENKLDPDAVYILWAGANDLLQILQSPNSDNSVDLAVAHIKDAITKLSKLGVNQVFVLNQVNMGKTPRTNELEKSFPGMAAVASQLTDQFNSSLSEKLDELDADVDVAIKIIPFDVFNLFEDIVANKNNYNLDNVSEACYVKDEFNVELTGDEIICDTPNRFLFWDSIHPTTVGHSILAEQLLQTINAN